MSVSKKRIFSVLLVICILLQTYIYAPLASAEASDAAYVPNSAQSIGYITLNGVNIEHSTTLTDNGDKTYTMVTTVTSKPTRQEVSNIVPGANGKIVLTAEKGVYSVVKDGWYLLDLWGGAGADVEGAGSGGKGGHVYGKVYLTAGQTLYYTLGSNGQATQKAHTGGGANGMGGGHGLVGSYTVGGGGGYSAVFLYNEGRFDALYSDFDFSKDDITEADRVTKFIMIAGGGGGGGATPDSGAIAGKAAHGGDGGSIGGTSGTVSGDNVIAGTYFSGSNGQSSGSSTSYVGKGASNVPGKVSDSMLGITDAEAVAPDTWFGTVDGKGGAGGSGELRGGGGGAGYAGGSGGLMTSVLIASNVGGGGGGSSFLVSTVNGKNTEYADIADAAAYLTESNPSSTGGALGITYLDNDDYSFLGDLTFENCFSPYTIPMAGGMRAVNSDGSDIDFSWEPHYDEVNHEKISLKHVSLLDGEENLGGSVQIELTFTYSTGFMGGNNVPIFRHQDSSYKCPITIVANISGEQREVVVELGEDCGSVNMPLRLEAHAHDLQANTPGTVFHVNQMFYDHYTDVRGNLENYDYEYDFIEKIGMYRIEDAGGKLIFDGEVDDPNVVTVAPNTRSDYTVKLPVTVKQNGVAKVGEPVKYDANGKLSISDVSTIEIPGSRHEQIGKFMVTYTKSVDYSEQDNLYTYTLNVKSTTTQEHNITPDTEGVNHVIDFDTNSVVEFEHTIEVTGWYLLQLWGGNGGNGGNSLFGSGSGGTGGTGGYVQGYVHLDKGDVVNIFMGVNGTDNSSKWATAGGGGKHSKAALIKSDGTETVLMIAGGGGGGGHYNFATGYNGSSVTETVTTGTANSANEYSAYDGRSGSGRNGGAAGKNYINTALVKTALNAEDNLDADAVNRFENAATGDYGGAATHGGGTVYVKCLQVTDDGFEEVINTLENALCDFGVKANVSKYFKIESVNVTDTDTEKEAYSASYNYTLGQDTALNIENINPNVTTVTSADEKIHSASVDFNIVIRMLASEGFAGGNDIPLFVDKIELNHTQIHRVDRVDQTAEESIELGENDSTDHVNVKLNYQKLTIEGSKLFFSEGDEPIPRDALYTIVAGETPVMPADDDWLYDYVDVINSITVLGDDEEVADLLAPEVTTEYMVRVGVAPKTSSSKARVCDVVEAEVSEDIAIIIVGHEVIFELENLVHNMTALHGKYIAEQDEDLVFSLTPDEDWLYPDDISISIDGKGELTAGVDYTYVKGSGKVTVKASAITGDVTVTASAKAPTYTLTFVYALTPDSSEFERVAQDFAEGADISGAFHSTYAPTAEGYTFHWDWGDGTTEAPDVMPGQDVWIIGRFAPNTYTVTVNFESEDSIELPETTVEEYKYGEQYVITIPYIDGYLSYVDGEVSETVQGIMVAENIEVTVEYRSSNGIFSVIYVNAKTGEQLKSVSEKIAVGNVCEHTIELPDGYKEGYTQGKTEDAPDSLWTSVSETMTEGGVLVTVYCIPNVYTVEFVIDEVVVDTRDVTYGEIYGYNSEGEYFDFVAPEKQDYTFDGWYLDGNRIYEDTAVATAQDHELVAVFTLNAPTQDKFVLTITYVKENGDSLYEAYTAELAEGEAYSVDSPAIGGFTPDKPTVSGTMQAHDVSVVVTYYADYSGEPVVLINVSWGSMSFGFEQGAWNPSTHQYDDDVFTPEAENANAIVIENVNSYVMEEGVEKKIKINATLSYTKNDGLEGMIDRLDGYFTRGGADSSEINGVEVSNGNSSTVYLWLAGDFNPDSDGLFEVGSCEVIISQGGYE